LQKFDSKGIGFNGYLAVPHTGKGPGVLVCHAWWGLNETFIGFCDLLAEKGNVALAPDYYQGKVAKTIPQAEDAASRVDRKNTKRMISAAADVLVSLPEVSGPEIGVLGCSLGAGFAVDVARKRSQNIRAVVLLYGLGAGLLDKTQAAYQGHFAENDQFDPPEEVAGFEKEILQAARPVEFFTYPGTDHWFMEPDRPEYHREAADLAWDRTFAFLKSTLPGRTSASP
jgi:carboxymethylenebutenolidase